MTSRDILNDLDFKETIPTPAAKIDYSKLGIRAGQLKDKMLTSFKYGKPRGITTHIDAVDKIFKWKPTFLYCITGYPQSGKSEWINFLALLKAKKEGWKWVVYSPESGDADEYFDQLIHTLVGRSTDPHYKNSQMSEQEYLKAIDFVHEHFFFIEDEMLSLQGLQPTPEVIRDIATHIHKTTGINGLIKDPWNTLTHKADRDDIYLSNQLAAEKRLAKSLKIVNVILAHPRSFSGQYDPKTGFPCPKATDIANGAMWNNKCDVIGAVHRTNYHTDKTDPFAVFVTHKVKKQNLVALPGEIQIKFERKENRYYIDGATPFIEPGLQPEFRQPEYVQAALPNSTFDTPF